MIEKVILDYLNGSNELDSPVYMEVPRAMPSKFFILEKTGGSISNHISESTIAVQSYAPSLYEASLANEKIKELMLYGLRACDEIVSVRLNSDYNFTDTTEKIYRYQAVFNITHY